MLSVRLQLLLGGLCSVAAQINVVSPRSAVGAFPAGRISGSTATFGAPFYGEKLLGELVWAAPRNASAPHCRLEDYEVPEPTWSETAGQGKLLRIFLVQRGGCTFVTKVLAAQRNGAHAVIIVDTVGSDMNSDRLQNFIMMDDGHGRNVQIPSIMITSAEGKELIKQTKENKQVIVELDWQVPTDSVVRVDVWMNSAMEESRKFLAEFAPKRKALNSAIQFVPRYNVKSGVFCPDGATYCVFDEGQSGISSKEILAEDVRQMCIHDLYKKSRQELTKVAFLEKSTHKVEFAQEFWDYVADAHKCKLVPGGGENAFGEACSKKLMRNNGISFPLVQDCVEKKGQQMMEQQSRDEAWSETAVRINGWRYSGALESDTILRAICAGFTQPPQVCKDMLEPYDPEIRRASHGVSFGTFVTVIIGFNLVALALLLLYKRALKQSIRKTLREEVMLEVQHQMADYMQLEEMPEPAKI